MPAGRDIVVRPATLGDEAAILNLWAAAYLNPPEADGARLVGLLKRRDTPVFVAVEGDRVVGSLICASDGWRGNMYRLAVAPGQRQRGIARRLVEDGESLLLAPVSDA